MPPPANSCSLHGRTSRGNRQLRSICMQREEVLTDSMRRWRYVNIQDKEATHVLLVINCCFRAADLWCRLTLLTLYTYLHALLGGICSTFTNPETYRILPIKRTCPNKRTGPIFHSKRGKGIQNEAQICASCMYLDGVTLTHYHTCGTHKHLHILMVSFLNKSNFSRKDLKEKC